MKTIIKKILLVYISIVLTFAPSSVFAASSGGWAFSSFDVATSVLTAMKNGGTAAVTVAKSPITAKIGKGILGGVIAGAAIPLAISQMSGIALEAVDWVLDPANNAIKYRDKTKPPPGVCSSNWGHQNMPLNEILSNVSGQGGGSYWLVESAPNGGGQYKFSVGWDLFISCSSLPIPYQSVPIPTVADKIYDNAKTDTNSRSVVNDAVKEYVNEGSVDVALDNAKADTDATHACGTGTHWSGSACVADTPSTPTTPTTDTPFDPSSIIDAIKGVFDAVMSLPDVINNALDDLLVDIKDFFQPAIDKVNDFVDWVKQEPPQDEAPKNVPVGQLSDVGLENQDRFQARIKFPAQCPSQQLTFNYFGRTYSHEIPFQALCQVLEMVAPIFVGVACLGVAFYIVREV